MGNSDAVRQRGRGFVSPGTDDDDYEGHAERESYKWHDPGNAVEAAGGRGGDYGRAVVLHEALHDEVVIVAAIQCGQQLIAHLVGRLAPDVIAFEQDLSASANAHHAMTELVAAGIVAGTHEKKNCQDYDGQLHATL